ncbi:MAG: hypothetical protein KDB14_24180 [Planctomycetales bacterium]|nr:hypothetical protein [Planctomycetales bacterium]
MTDREFDNYLALLSGMLKLSRHQREAISSELRDHLEERLSELLEEGASRDEAIRLALEEFGDASHLAEKLAPAARRTAPLRRGAIAAGLAAALLGWLTLRPQTATTPTGPTLAGVAVAQDAPAHKNTRTVFRSTEPERSEKLEAALSRKVSVEYVDVPLEVVVAEISKQVEAPMRLDRRALEESVIPLDSPVNFSLKDVTARSVLRHMLQDLNLTYLVRDGVIEVTTPEACEDAMETAVYPVADLAKSDPTKLNDYDNLTQLLLEMTDRDTWSDVGGPGAIHGPYRGTLTISQSNRVHEQLEALIDAMRKLDLQSTSVITAGERAIEQDLRKRLLQVVSVEYVDLPLEDVVAELQKSVAAPILLDRRALEDAVINADKPITFTSEGLPLNLVLKSMLREHDLAHLVRDEVILITTREVAESLLETRLYPVHDLTKPSPEIPPGELQEFYEEELANLTELISTNVAPDTWSEVGGPGSIVAYQQRLALAVSQTPEVHEQIEQVLAALRRAESSAYSSDADSASHQELKLVVYPVTSDPDKVIEAIRNYVSPDSWSDAAENDDAAKHGDRPSIMAIRTDPTPGAQVVAHRILVRHRGSVHRQLRAFLQLLGNGAYFGGMGSGMGGMGGGGMGGGGGGFF